MEKFKILFYEKENGESPVEDFINSLDTKTQAKLIGLMELLEEKGTSLREPYTKYLKDGIFEIRCQFGSNISRVLYFFFCNKKIILTNGFVKKTQKTPPNQIKIAKQRQKDFMKRMI